MIIGAVFFIIAFVTLLINFTNNEINEVQRRLDRDAQIAMSKDKPKGTFTPPSAPAEPTYLRYGSTYDSSTWNYSSTTIDFGSSDSSCDSSCDCSCDGGD